MKNKYIADYISNSPDSILLNKDYLHKIISTLFPEEVYDLEPDAYKQRSISKITPADDMIELTPEIENEIKYLIIIPSKCKHLIFSFLVMPCHAINYWLKSQKLKEKLTLGKVLDK